MGDCKRAITPPHQRHNHRAFSDFDPTKFDERSAGKHDADRRSNRCSPPPNLCSGSRLAWKRNFGPFQPRHYRRAKEPPHSRAEVGQRLLSPTFPADEPERPPPPAPPPPRRRGNIPRCRPERLIRPQKQPLEVLPRAAEFSLQ